MKKALVLAALAFLSVSAQAQPQITDLVNASRSIVSTFDLGIQTVAGVSAFAQEGGIAPTGMASQAYIQKEQQTAYNQAVANFSNGDWTYTAEDYAQEQKAQADLEMQAAINAYVEASAAVMEVVTVNNMAENIGDTTTAEGEAQAQQLQSYIAGTDVTLEDSEVAAYNDSLESVQNAASEMAAFTALSADVELQAALEQGVADLGESIRNADNSFFSQGNLTIEFSGATSAIALDMSTYFKTSADILTRGATEDFYKTGPTQNTCFFAQTQEEYDACIANQTGA